MHIQSFHIENIRSLKQIEWEIDIGAAPGWHVIIGDNGSGKSSILRALALALVGPTEAPALRQDWGSWLREGEKSASMRIALQDDRGFDKFSGSGGRVQNYYLLLRLRLERSAAHGGRVDLKVPRVKFDPKRHVWGEGKGWFSASYGPFRRFRGGDKDYEKMFYTLPKAARHLSVFGENVALTECLSWLRELHFKRLEKKPEGELLEPLSRFINQEDFLPHRARLSDVSEDGVKFVDGDGCRVMVDELSDGYRSILSMTFELIRQLALAYGSDRIFDEDAKHVIAPGVVLIDEVDAHLHPTWQRRIGLWFRKHFPKIQFIVTTHSPLVCQASDQGTVYRLPRPGSSEKGAFVRGTELQRLLYGNVLDAYSTDLFGEDVGRSDAGEAKLRRLAELNLRELDGELTKAEKTELLALRAALPTAAHILRGEDE